MTFTIDKSTWTRVKFGDVVRKSKEKVDPTLGEVEYYVAGEHMETDNLHIDNKGIIGDGYLGPAFHMRFHPGQVLYGSRRTYLRKVAYADFDGVCANTTFVLETADESKLAGRFLPFIMQAEPFHEHAIAVSKGSTNPYVNWPDIAAYEFLLPPIEEQHRIADLLWNVTNHLKLLRNSANSLVDLERETILEHQYGNDNIATLCESKVGFPFPSKQYSTDENAGPRVIRGINIGVGQFRPNESVFFSGSITTRILSNSLNRRDIVIPMDRPFTANGRLRYLTINEELEGSLLAQRTLRLRPVEGAYSSLLSVVRSSKFQRSLLGEQNGSFAPHLSESSFFKFYFDAQFADTLASILEKTDAGISYLAVERLQLSTLFNVLVSSIFGGRDVF